ATRQLRTVADNADIATIRRYIIQSAGAFQTMLAKMAEESRDAVKRLTAQADQYRTRLEETERLSLMDPLTGLKNRPGLERVVMARMEHARRFSVIVIDLDGLKQVNDRYGHIAGDDLLKQFAGELKSQFTPDEVMARIGGDEFVGLIGDDLGHAEERIARIR